GAFDLADLVGQCRAAVQQLQQFAIDRVDLGAKLAQVLRHQASPSAPAASGTSPSASAAAASFSTMRCSPLSLEPSSSPISVTPCVARPSSRISLTRVRTSTPL